MPLRFIVGFRNLSLLTCLYFVLWSRKTEELGKWQKAALLGFGLSLESQSGALKIVCLGLSILT